MGANAVALPPGFELQPQGMGVDAGTMPGEGAGPGREVAGSRVDPRQGMRQPPATPQNTPRMPAQQPMAAPAATTAPAGGPPPLPPGFELQQEPSAAAAPPPRQVGLLETMGRTAASAAIPVVRSIDMAAAGMAGMLAPLLGLSPQEEQAKIFRDSDARVARMRQEYAQKPDEQFSTPGQIAGGVLSAPIEMTGGMGLQHGIDTSAEVLQRGGTGQQAALAGGVSSGVHAALNLLPVKAGGAVGRAVEGVVAKGIGQKVAPVAAGALTGGAISAGGDVAGTAAENAALPEGDEFASMRQEANPALSFGMGAAFGGAAGRQRGARPARAEPAERTPRAGAGAPAGSVGAAGADVETARRERAASLAVPIELSKGEAMGPEGKFEQMQFERETAKGEAGEPLRQAAAEKNERLIRNFDAYIDEVGAEAVMPRDVGQSVDKALRQKLEARKAEVSKAYDAAREAGDMAEPVKTDDLVAYLNKTGPESINAPVLQTVREKLVQLGGAKRDGEGGLTAGEIPINDLEEIRKMINRVSDTTPTNMTFGREVKEKIDAMTANAGGDLYREARRLRINLGAEFNNRAVINDLLRNKRGSADRAVALEDVLDRAILRRSVDDVQHLRKVLQTAGPDGVQAWKDLQGQVLSHLKEQATKSVQRDIRGNPVVSAAGLDKAIRALDDGRLELIFGKKGAETLRDLNDVANNVLTSPPGSVNTSNTAASLRAMLVNAIDTMVTFSASGVPVPALAVAKKAIAHMRERGLRKRVAQALEQPDNLTPVDRPAFGSEAIDPETGEVTQAVPTVAAQPGGATDPRLAEIARLRAASSNPEVHDVLDRRQRKVEAEIAANKQQAERMQQAEELDALARSSTDPEIRKALAARAEKLRGGPIPVGEAREVTVHQAEPAGSPELPVGEATELTPEQVEPAPRPAEAPRSAAGSDTEAELTMLQPGAPAKGTKKQPMYKRAGEAPDTPEFRNWFKGSKVVDETGQPLVVHHGTPASDLQVFDVRRIGEGGRAEGPGFYFTTDRPTAEGYGQRGKTLDVYLNIQKPLAYDAKPFTQAQLRKLLTEIAKVEAKETGGDWRDGYLSNYVDTYSSRSVDDAARQAAGSFDGDETALDQVSGIVGAGVPAATVNAGLTTALGYDGYVSKGFSGKGQSGGDIWVAMRPEQIKSATGNRGTFDPNDPNIMNKRGGLPAKPFKARAELENALRAKLGHKLVDGLLKRNVITLGEAPADVPRDAQGRFTGSVVELFHDRLDAENAPAVLMHEVGAHYGMEKMLGEQRYAEVLADLAKMRQRPDVARAWQQVLDNYPLKEGSPEFLSEVAAHLVESAPDRPIVRRLLDAPRAYLYSNFGVNIGRTDPQLVRALAVGALRKSAGVEAVSPNPAALATAGAKDKEEATAQ